MRLSLERLTAEATSTGFRSDVLEKAAHLLGLLESFRSHPFLKGKLALKGGTALNLFVFDVPRLSVDIDLNYVGGQDREAMLAERPKIEQALRAVFARQGFAVRRVPEEHAGGKWLLRYPSASGQTGNLEVDLNFMFRVPLWPLAILDSQRVGAWRATGIPVLDVHELAAGKLAALLSRGQARDLFDSHRLLRLDGLDRERLRLTFVLYGAMNRRDWRKVSIDDVAFDGAELVRQLTPTLRGGGAELQIASKDYGPDLVAKCRRVLSAVLPFTEDESLFLDMLLSQGEIDPAILTADTALQDRIRRHPRLRWKALNVRRYKDFS